MHVTVQDSPSQPSRILPNASLRDALRSLPSSLLPTPPRGSSSLTLISHPPPLEALTAELKVRVVQGEVEAVDPKALATIPLSTPPVPRGNGVEGREADEEDGGLWGRVLYGTQGPERTKQASTGDASLVVTSTPLPSTTSAPPQPPKRDTSSWPLILVTGGAGYIGSHVVLELLRQGEHGVVVVDNFNNSGREALRRVRLLVKEHYERQIDPLTPLASPDRLFKGSPPKLQNDSPPPLFFHEFDIRDRPALSHVFALYTPRIRHVIHFAALKSVPLSLRDPLSYYSTNVAGTLTLLSIMQEHGVRSLVFSSSAVVYGAFSAGLSIPEAACSPQAPEAYEGLTNVYGRTKLMCESMIEDVCWAGREEGFRAVVLRYTNPSGNDQSGLIGDAPRDAANLMPVVSGVLQGKRDSVMIYGADWDTKDGTGAAFLISGRGVHLLLEGPRTGVRDFIHVSDLAAGHTAALHAFDRPDVSSNYLNYNLGTGQGCSVAEIIESLSTISQRPIKTVVTPRRPGDLGCVVCDPSKAERDLGWKAKRTLVDMARDLWMFCLRNPDGLISIEGQGRDDGHVQKQEGRNDSTFLSTSTGTIDAANVDGP